MQRPEAGFMSSDIDCGAVRFFIVEQYPFLYPLLNEKPPRILFGPLIPSREQILHLFGDSRI